MPTITCPLEKNERMGWSTYQFRVDGLNICGLTEQTGHAAAMRLKALYEAHADELLSAVQAVNERRQWNHDHPGQGKDWPAFRNLDRLCNRLQKEAGIKDS